jgi:CHAT domain-containing protein/Tfp pilus assembly protein PilF
VPGLVADVALRRGTCDLERGHSDAAETRFRQALKVARATGLKRLEAHAAGSLGLVRLRASRYDDAADWIQHSLELSAGESVDVKLLGNLGWCYRSLGDTDKALPLLLKAEAIARSDGYSEDLEVILYHLGNVHIQLGDLAAARKDLARSLELARGLGQLDNQQDLLELLQPLALQEGDTQGAHDYARESARLSATAGAPEAASSLVDAELAAARGDSARAEQLYRQIAASKAAPDLHWRALAGIANLDVGLGRHADAEQAFQQATQAIEQMRAGLKQDTFDFLLFSSLNEFYGRYAAFLVDLGRPEAALALVDRSRGRVLWERLGPRATAQPAQRFEESARAVGAVLLSYWVGERSFLWVVTAHSTEVHELPSAAVLRAKVERFQSLVLRSRDPLDPLAPEATDLYRTLLSPAASRIPKGSRVIVVPDGPLHQLSFDTLVVEAPYPHYWIEDVVSLRTPSLGLLRAPRAPGWRADRTLLMLGDPLPPDAAFPALPNAARELAEVQRHFPKSGVRVVSGNAATPSAYAAADPESFEYIHFAAHATSNAEQPLESAVVLSRDEAGYKLYAHEIVARPIRAEMVTLSACRGAGARSYRGEGLVGFAWAFLRAGARHVVAGLWDVEDASTSSLMGDLYAGLAAGAGPAEALREARLALLRSSGPYRKPFYWGPFVLYAQQQGR